MSNGTELKRLAGKNIIVVGGGGELGAATGLRLAVEGANVLLVGLSEEKLRRTQATLENAGGSADVAVCDVQDAAGLHGIVARAKATFGSIDGLANFSAVLSRAGLEETSEEVWAEIMGVNLTGAWLTMRAVVPEIREAGGGAIVNIGSIDALIGRGMSTAYAASKGGLRALTKSAAIEYASERIRINSVHPSSMETRVSHMVGPSDPDLDVDAMLAALTSQIPLGRLGAAGDVAAAVSFLLSDDAQFITGVDLPVDGGYSAR